LARKIATVTLVLWKKGAGFNVEQQNSKQLERLLTKPAFPSPLLPESEMARSLSCVQGWARGVVHPQSGAANRSSCDVRAQRRISGGMVGFVMLRASSLTPNPMPLWITQ
jgi:hypothetical protein